MVAVASLAAAAAAAAVLTVELSSDDHRPAASVQHAPPSTAITGGTGITSGTELTSAAARTDTPELATWVRDNLPTSGPILTDGASAALLAGVGVPTDTDYANCHRDRFVLVTAAVRQRAAEVPALAGCLAASQPVATVGQGASSTELRAINADPQAARAARRQARADRRLGGAALSRNPAITMPPEVRREVLAGRLDLRAETVLVALAQRTPFRIEVVHAVPAEAAAGMPARSVLVGLADPPGPTWFRTHLSPGYRPSEIARSGPRTEWLTWSFAAAPPPVLK